MDDSDSLAVPERHWGVLERMIRSDLAHAGAHECCWPWSASQNNRLLYYLPTNAHDPPMSPHQWHTKETLPVDISWARTMFYDVTVTAPERDWHGKLGQRSCDGSNHSCRPPGQPAPRRPTRAVVLSDRPDNPINVFRHRRSGGRLREQPDPKSGGQFVEAVV